MYIQYSKYHGTRYTQVCTDIVTHDIFYHPDKTFLVIITMQLVEPRVPLVLYVHTY